MLGVNSMDKDNYVMTNSVGEGTKLVPGTKGQDKFKIGGDQANNIRS